MRGAGPLLPVLLFVVAAAIVAVDAYAYQTLSISTAAAPTVRTAMTMKRAAGRRGGFQKSSGGMMGSAAASSRVGRGTGAGGAAPVNWIPLSVPSRLVSQQEEGKVAFIDTNLPTLKNTATNPTGAVSVLRHGGQTYCFSSSCPCCKIPMTKSSVRDDGRLVCGFCRTGYDLRTGAKADASPEDGGGIFGGVVKSVFKARDSGPLPMYRLGEKDGKLLIALD